MRSKWKDQLHYRLSQKRKSIQRNSKRGWSGISLLVIPEDPRSQARQFRINYFVLIFSITLTLLPFLISTALQLQAASNTKQQKQTTLTRYKLLAISMRLSMEKRALLTQIKRDLQIFPTRFPKLSNPNQKYLWEVAENRTQATQRQIKPGVHRSRYELELLLPLQREMRELVRYRMPFIFQTLWNRLTIHYLMPRGWALLGGVGHVTSIYGMRRNPLEEGNEFHSGVDFAYIAGTPIIATAPGIVIRAVNEPKSGYGKFVQLHHGLGYTSLYAHCQSVVVNEGQQVERGQVIAYLGRTGRVTGEHLHYEVQLGWAQATNPLPFIKLK